MRKLKHFFFFKFLKDISPFRGAIDTNVLDFWWYLPWVSKPGWIPCMLSRLCDPQIHLWCNTCRLYRGQHGSLAFLIHIPADVSANIGGGLGLKPTTIHATCSKHGTVHHSAHSYSNAHQNLLWHVGGGWFHSPYPAHLSNPYPTRTYFVLHLITIFLFSGQEELTQLLPPNCRILPWSTDGKMQKPTRKIYPCCLPYQDFSNSFLALWVICQNTRTSYVILL